MIISHNHIRYARIWERAGDNRYNGAYYYSREIVKNIIPRVETDRSWVTVNMIGECAHHSIFFIHNNLKPEKYEWIQNYGFRDVIYVCGTEATYERWNKEGVKAIYLPLSIDKEYVQRFERPKTKQTAFAGRKTKTIMGRLPEDIDYLMGMKRIDLLAAMAEYKEIYAVGRTAIEAKALGCKVLPYDARYPDPRMWKVIDNKDAAKILQDKLNEIDR